MKLLKTSIVAAAAGTLVTSGGCVAEAGGDPPPPPPAENEAGAQQRTMRAFASRAELAAYLRELAARQRALRRRSQAEGESMPASASEMPAAAADVAGQGAKAEESVTNVQHAGVDEGGIVKVHGEHLVMLRRGRLFTVKIGGGDLRPVAAVDAFGPGVDPVHAWYDEMLVSGDQVIVIGYSYARGGTEVGLFRIGRDGSLTHRSTYHLRSNDYYSSRNYASRLIDGKLVFYTPLYLPLGDDPFQGMPAIRRWRPGAGDDEFRPLVSPTRVYRPERPLGDGGGTALHTVTVCDLAGGEMDCKGTAVLGPAGRVFYVSPKSVYVWVTEWRRTRDGEGRTASVLYRMPLDGSAPSALGVRGSPVDQFSFLESDDGHLNVLVRADGGGEAMWSSEASAGDAALLRVAAARFGDGSGAAPTSAYRPLPKPAGYTFQNRFVGPYLLYGTGSGWGPPETSTRPSLFAVPWRGGAVAALALPHGVDRIETMGPDAVVVGTDGRDLHFSAVRLGARPEVVNRYTMANASQGELRSHGFFYRPEGASSGMLGLPVHGPGRPGHAHLTQGSASILFLRNEALRFRELGTLDAGTEGSGDDGCRASCVDWYGNARPLFLRGRIFALLGYELVEGALDDGRIRETRRVSYSPRATMAANR